MQGGAQKGACTGNTAECQPRWPPLLLPQLFTLLPSGESHHLQHQSKACGPHGEPIEWTGLVAAPPLHDLRWWWWWLVSGAVNACHPSTGTHVWHTLMLAHIQTLMQGSLSLSSQNRSLIHTKHIKFSCNVVCSYGLQHVNLSLMAFAVSVQVCGLSS